MNLFDFKKLKHDPEFKKKHTQIFNFFKFERQRLSDYFSKKSSLEIKQMKSSTIIDIIRNREEINYEELNKYIHDLEIKIFKTSNFYYDER
jgi:hypothetical protein